MATTTSLKNIHIFPNIDSYRTNRNSITANDLAIIQDDAFGFTGTLSENGEIKFPNGLVMKWGSTTSSADTCNVTFPTPFSNAIYNIQLTVEEQFTNDSGNNVHVISKSLTGFSMITLAKERLGTIKYLAIGI